MILNLDKKEGSKLYIDIDHISLLDIGAKVCILDGVTVALTDNIVDDIEKAYIAIHKSHMYNDELKKIRWVKGENK